MEIVKPEQDAAQKEVALTEVEREVKEFYKMFVDKFNELSEKYPEYVSMIFSIAIENKEEKGSYGVLNGISGSGVVIEVVESFIKELKNDEHN